MEKLKEALNKLDELAVKMDGIMGVSFLLWESIDGGSDMVDSHVEGDRDKLVGVGNGRCNNFGCCCIFEEMRFFIWKN